jgi:glycosyltransferase involved in cell wall biosynthesis
MTRNKFASKNKPLDIAIFIYSGHGESLQNPDYPELNPVGGSETAALRLAQAFRDMGHSVRLVTDTNQIPGLSCEVFVSLRLWQEFYDGYYPGKVNYLWCQDDFNQEVVEQLRDPKIALPVYKRLNGLFMLSTYQQVQWIRNLNLTVDKIIPTTNGIPVEKFSVDLDALRQRKPWCYYSSTPFRGLDKLLQAWPDIVRAVPDARLHLFTSMKVYNADEKDDYQRMYDLARTLPGVDYRGSVGQAELRETAMQCRALAYPCTFPETSCIAAMEAMAAGCAVVSTSTGALIETAWKNPLIAPGGDWLPIWTRALVKVLKDDDEYERLARQNCDIARFYDWALIAQQWVKKFREDLNP